MSSTHTLLNLNIIQFTDCFLSKLFFILFLKTQSNNYFPLSALVHIVTECYRSVRETTRGKWAIKGKSLVEKCSSPLCSLNKRHEDWSEILLLRFLSIFFTRANCWTVEHGRMFPLFIKRMIKTFLNFKRCFSSILTDEEANSFNMSSVTITLQNLFFKLFNKNLRFCSIRFFLQ